VVFTWLADQGPVEDAEMWRTFNCGIGMVAIVGAEVADDALALLADRGVSSWVCGRVRAAAPGTDRVAISGRA
jgi:phosphoribosylformylglycinamidine cyclo-ligase